MLLTRTAENNARTAARLSALGYEPVSLALGKLVSTAPEKIEYGDAAIITSSAAVDVLADSDVKVDSSLPVFCVGERTKATAQKLGFKNIVKVAGDAQALCELMIEYYSSASASISYFSGRNISFDFVKAFANTNIEIAVTQLYEIVRITPDRLQMEEALSQVKNGVQLHFSQLSASYFFDLIRKFGLEDACKSMNAVAISEKTSLAVDKTLVKSVQNAKMPTETGVIAALDNFVE